MNLETAFNTENMKESRRTQRFFVNRRLAFGVASCFYPCPLCLCALRVNSGFN